MVEAEMNTRMAGILSAADVQQLIHQTELEAGLDSLLGDGVIEQSRVLLPAGPAEIRTSSWERHGGSATEQ